MSTASGLLNRSGQPIPARDIAAIRARASLTPGVGNYTSPWAYDGAVPQNQEMLSWLPWLRSPDTEINFDRDRMVARARDLVRNDGWAKGAINRLLDSAIGSNFFPVPRPNWKALARHTTGKFDQVWATEFQSAIASEWKLWANSTACDATRTQNFAQIMRTALRHKLVDGDSLAMAAWEPDRAGPGSYATTILLIDPDRLSNPNTLIDTHDRRGGVHIDDVGAPISYTIRRAHQSDPYDSLRSITWDEFERSTDWGRPIVVHDFDRERSGGHRGIGILTEVLARFRMLNRYDATSLQAAALRAVMGFFVTSSQTENDIRDALEAQTADGVAADDFFQNLSTTMYAQQPVTIGGVRIPVLAPNDKIQTVAGGGHVDDFEAFHGAGLRLISAGTGQAAEEISNDFSKLNYSSFRGAMLQAHRTMIRRRTDFAVNTASPLYGCWLEEFATRFPELLPAGISAGDLFGPLRVATADVKWIGPGRGWVDPVKERQGEVLGLDAGFGTLEDSCADLEGEWWEDRLEQRKVEHDKFRALGLPLPQVFTGQDAQEAEQKPQPA